MQMNVVAIAVGGIGEGIIVHQKQAEQMDAFAAATIAGITPGTEKLLVSSPLAERHYADPMNEVSVNTAAGSPEFTPLGTDIQTVLDSIRRGDCTAVLRYWFTSDVADALPERVNEVLMGTGKQAVLAKTAADLEATRIIGEIRKAIRRARSAASHTVVAVMFGAGSGGTGTGAGLEVLRAVRIIADNLKEITVVLIPVLGARGCELLQDSQIEVNALYARTAGVYFATCAAQAGPHAVPYSLSDNVVVTAQTLADIVWVVEGDVGDSGAPKRTPMYGLAKAAQGILEAVNSEAGALGGAFANWRQIAGQAEPSSRIGSAGASSIRVDGLHLHSQATLLRCVEFYDRMLARPAGAVNAGLNEASQLLAGFPAATLVRAHAAGEQIAWQPPDGSGVRTMAGLAEHLTEHDGGAGPFPCSPNHDVKHLPDEVNTARISNLALVSNKTVVTNSDAITAEYMGDARVQRGREDAWTVAGWLAAERSRVAAEFDALIESHMLQGSIDPNTGRARTIGQTEGQLRDMYDLLATLFDRITAFRSAAQRHLDAASPLIERRASAHEASRSELLDSPKSGSLQRQHLQVAQDDLDVRVWQAEMKAWIDIASDWRDCVKSWLDEVGEGAGGWCSYLQMLREDVRAQSDNLLANRRALACASNHIYVPQIGEAGEDALHQELSHNPGYLDQLFNNLRLVWSLDKERRPRLMLEGLEPAPSRERESVVQHLRELGSSTLSEYKVTNHVPADVIHYVGRVLKRSYQSLSVWDGLAFDYNHIEIPAADRESRTPHIGQWTNGVIDDFLRGSAPELVLTGTGAGDAYLEKVVWGPMALTGIHPSAAKIAAAARSVLGDGAFAVVDTPASTTVLRAFQCALRIKYDRIALYEPMVAALKAVPAAELGLYAPEMAVRRSETLRRVLEDAGIKREPWTFGPAAMTLTADSDGTDGSLRRASLGRALDLFDPLPGRVADADHIGIVVDNRKTIDLGPGEPLAIIEALRSKANAKAVAELDARIEDYIADFRREDGVLDPALAEQLADIAADWAHDNTTGTEDEQDVHLLMIAELLDLSEAFAKKSGRGDGAPPSSGRQRGGRRSAHITRAASREMVTTPVAISSQAEAAPRPVSWAGTESDVSAAI